MDFEAELHRHTLGGPIVSDSDSIQQLRCSEDAGLAKVSFASANPLDPLGEAFQVRNRLERDRLDSFQLERGFESRVFSYTFPDLGQYHVSRAALVANQ